MGPGGLDPVEVFESLPPVSGDFVVPRVRHTTLHSLNVIAALFMKGFFVSVSSVSSSKTEIQQN